MAVEATVAAPILTEAVIPPPAAAAVPAVLLGTETPVVPADQAAATEALAAKAATDAQAATDAKAVAQAATDAAKAAADAKARSNWARYCWPRWLAGESLD